MTSFDPVVTVLMPVHNAEQYLGAAIESILAQTYRDFEYLIINDGCTDNSRQIITHYIDPRIRLVDNEGNLGLTATLNRGLSLARGRFVARQDADDISFPQRLVKQVDFLNLHPEVALVGTQGYIIDHEGNYLSFLVTALDMVSIRWRQCFDNSFVHSAVMFRKDVVWNELGGYNAQFSYCQDFELWSRLLQKYRAANLPDRLIKWRDHRQSMTVKMSELALTEGQQVMRCNLETVFGHEYLLPSEFEQLVNFKYNSQQSYTRSFWLLFERLLHRYLELYPEAVTSGSFKAVIAEQYTRLGFGVMRHHPVLGLRLIARAIRYSSHGAFLKVSRRPIRWWSTSPLIKLKNYLGLP